jgi:hypothetical protein
MPECSCGEWVSLKFARIFGDRDDQVEICLECSEREEIRRSTLR